MYQIQQIISYEDMEFHENAMGPMYHISIVFSLTLRQPSLYHQLYMIGSCILEHRSNYSFDIVTSMGMPASSIYMSHIHCISPIDGNQINTKTKSHHALASEAPPLHSKSYDVRRPYVELLPSHIRGQYVNPKIPHLSLNGLHHPRTPSHNSHITPLDLPLDPHTSKRAQG